MIIFDVKHRQEVQLIETQFMSNKQKAESLPERCMFCFQRAEKER